MIALLDTSILVASGSTADDTPDLSGFDDLRVPTISWSELTMGLHAAGSVAVYKEREARLMALRATYGDGVAYDDRCVEAYATLLTRVVARHGDPQAHRVDRMIAATALAHSMTILTRNVADFAMFGDLLPIEQR